MLRASLSSVVVLVILLGGLLAADEKDKKADNDKKGAKATITKVDAKKGTVTVKMKDKEGKDVEKTFKLTEDVRMWDSTGRVVAIDVFESGNDVLIVEQDGKLRELKKAKDSKSSSSKDKK